MNYEEKIHEVSEAFNRRDTLYSKIAPIMAGIFETSGIRGIKEFAKDVENYRGKEVPVNTLLSYSWIYRRVGNLPVPQDLPISVYRLIASIKGYDVRKKFVDKINKEGLSANDIRYLLKYR